MKPSSSEPQIDKGKGIIVSCENDNTTPAKSKLLVFWPHSVFGQNHLSGKML
jgi:hypothetical protein